MNDYTALNKEIGIRANEIGLAYSGLCSGGGHSISKGNLHWWFPNLEKVVQFLDDFDACRESATEMRE